MDTPHINLNSKNNNTIVNIYNWYSTKNILCNKHRTTR
jgi:hypothetical protein